MFGCFQVAHRQREAEADVAAARERLFAALEVAGGLVFEVGVEGAAANAHNRFRNVQCRVGRVRQRRRRPFPDVADELVDAAHAGAAGKFIDRHRRVVTRTIQMSPANVERFAPGITSLRDPARRRFDGPGRRFGPLGVARQSLADPARVGPRFEPTDADDRQMLIVGRILAVAPEARPGSARLIDEIEQGGQRFFVPEFELLVAAGVDELLVFGVGDTEAIQVNRRDHDQIAPRQFRVDFRLAAGRVRHLGKLADEHAAGRHQSHRFVELADRSHQLELREMLLCFRPEHERVAAVGEQFVDECVGAFWRTIALRQLLDRISFASRPAVRFRHRAQRVPERSFSRFRLPCCERFGVSFDAPSHARRSMKHRIAAPTPSKLALCQTSPQTKTDTATATIDHRETD